MLHKLFILPFFILPTLLSAQHDRMLDSVLDNKIIQLPFYKQSTVGNKSIFLKMNFGRPEILDTTGVSALYNAEILSVDLVFTDYPSTQTLKPLNKKRFQNLIQLCPNIVQQKQAQWQIIRQMDGRDKATAEKLLHGIVVNYRDKPAEAFHQKEIAEIKQFEKLITVVEPSKPAAIAEPAPKKKVNYWSVIHGGQITQPRYYANKPLKEVSNKPIVVGTDEELIHTSTKTVKNFGLLTNDEQQRFGNTDSVYLLVGKPIDSKTTTAKEIENYVVAKEPLKDSSLIKPLLRSKWDKPLVVADVTLSMSPYIVQLLNWLGKPEQKNVIQYFACFNDGDDMENEKKKTGQTGGIYGSAFTNIKAITQLVESTMEKGSGGDTPENVCEAIIKSLAMHNDCNEVILMADNWAAARDIELVKQIHKPVRVIICGGSTGTHVDYINIALQTNGSLHFEDNDVTNLQNLKAGKEVTIRGVNYKLNEAGNVVAVRK
jgi:hypothetical protein